MKILFLLVYKDFIRQLKKPWVVLTFMAIPVLMTWMISSVFGTGKEAPEIVLHVAVLDQDKEFFSSMLRSMSSQSDEAKNLKVHLVDNLDEGVRLIEDRKVSALLVFPKNMTTDLLDGATAAIELYKNPAQTVLPQIIEQGADIFAVGVSGVLSFMGPEVKKAAQLFDSDTLPPSWGTAMIVYEGMQKLETAKTYLFPPIINMKTISADEYLSSASPEIRAASRES